MEINNCPYLGIIDDPHTCANFADGANACHRIKPPMLLALDYQRTTCLQATHRECPGYVDDWKDGFPRSIGRRQPRLSPTMHDGLAWFLLMIPVILFIWAGFTSRLAFLSFDFRSSTANTPTSLPVFTRMPTETATPTETFTPTFSQTETFISTTEPDAATPNQTDIRIATETGTLQPTGTATRLFSTALPNTPIPTNTSTQPPTLPPTQPPTTQPPPPTTTPQPTSTPQPTNTPTPDIRPTEP